MDRPLVLTSSHTRQTRQSRQSRQSRLCLLGVMLVAAACGDLKPAGPSAPDAAPVAGDAASSGDAARTGPGPHGSLPSGYCCSADAECRYRHCADAGGVRMCLDECMTAAFCTRPDLTFTCPAVDAGPRLCAPPPGFACLDPATFLRGPKEIGGCCNADPGGRNDGTAGSVCEGNQCTATGDGPLVCTHRCQFQQDCPAGFQCALAGTSKTCVRSASSYTCE